LQAIPEEGLFGTCKKISDKSCVDKCVMKSFDNLRSNPGNYQLFNRNGGQNCHKWAQDTAANCIRQCGGAW
jgi:hypothetical protein